jgi:anti-anti-sigma factor
MPEQPATARRPGPVLTPREFSVTSRRHGATHLIAPCGELDLATSPALEREILRVERTGAARIELDLAGLTFIDSAGIRVLAGAEIRSRGGPRLRLKPGPRAVQRVLAIVGADETLPFMTSPASKHEPPAGVDLPCVTDWSR